MPTTTAARAHWATIEHLDHEPPFKYRPGQTAADFAMACGSCNCSRGTKPLSAFVKERGIADTVAPVIKAYLLREEINFENLKFVFAKTMPEIPHYYVKRTPENEKDYVALFNAIMKVGVVQKWRGKPYRYWYRGDGYKYWATSALGQSLVINRAEVDAPTSKIDEESGAISP